MSVHDLLVIAKLAKPCRFDDCYFSNHVAPIIIKYEGSKFTNDPKDPGGPTKYGITLKTMREIEQRNVSINELKNLTEQKAISYYKYYFWDRYGASKIKHKSLSLTVVMSQINLGPYRPNLMLQKMTNKICNGKLVLDGIIGKNSISFINNCKYLWPGFPYTLFYFYSEDKHIAPVWRWAKRGLKRRIFFGVNHE